MLTNEINELKVELAEKNEQFTNTKERYEQIQEDLDSE